MLSPEPIAVPATDPLTPFLASVISKTLLVDPRRLAGRRRHLPFGLCTNSPQNGCRDLNRLAISWAAQDQGRQPPARLVGCAPNHLGGGDASTFPLLERGEVAGRLRHDPPVPGSGTRVLRTTAAASESRFPDEARALRSPTVMVSASIMANAVHIRQLAFRRRQPVLV
jgi:hypothetical protein